MKNRSASFTIVSMFLYTGLIAQLPTLQAKLQGQDRVEDIMEIVDTHYAEIKSGVRKRTDELSYKHWARWGLYMSARTDERGRVVDADRLTQRALENYSSPQRTTTGSWSSMGPTAISGTNGSSVGIGRADRIAFHPTDENILYVGTTAGGVFKSTNGGTSWSAISSNLPSTAISGIVVSHADPNVVYILTGDGDAANGGFIEQAGYLRRSRGVFVSYDGGVNWYPTGSLNIADPYTGLALAMDPNNANVLLAATSLGLFRTNNGGTTWTEVMNFRTFEVKFKPGSSSIVYATQLGGFFRSTDGGLTWIEIINFDVQLHNSRIAMAVTNAASGRVYLLDGWADGNDDFGGMFLSTDSGISFTRQSNTPNIVESSCDGSGGNNQSMYDLAIGVSHTTVSRVVGAGITTWRSSDTGVTWVNASAGRCSESESTGFVHADVHDIEYNPLNNDVYLCSDGGLVKSINHGLDWINLSDGLVASQIYHMAGTFTFTDNMMIGLQDNGVKRRDENSTVWDQVLSADGYDCIYNNGSAGTGYLTWNAKVNRFSANGSNRVDISPDSSFFPRVSSSINSSAVVLAGYSDIYRSEDNGNTWTNVGASGFWDIERCPSNNNRFYAAGGSSAFATTGAMWRSDDIGETWTVISGNTGYPATAGVRMTDIDVRPNDSGDVWITFGGFSNATKVFFSSDGGVTWLNRTGTLPNIPINAIQVDVNNNAYIGTDIGVFYRGANMSDWVPYSHLLPILPVTDLELYEADGFIRASTFGRGVWQSDTYETCATSMNLSVNFYGHHYYEATDLITTDGAIYGGQTTRVTFKSDGAIIFEPGFKGSYGTYVRGYISPCGVADNEEN